MVIKNTLVAEVFDAAYLKSGNTEEDELVRPLLESGLKIPPQPRVLRDIASLLHETDLDVQQLVQLITQDPGITAMLFKVVSSSAYRQYGTFRSIEQIVLTLGSQRTANLLHAIAMSAHPERALPGIQRAYEAFWARSQSVAQLAMIIADERVTVCNIFPDQAYLVGIFHDCGVPVLMQRFPDYCGDMRLAEPGKWTDLTEENRRYATDHAVVGYLVARYWNLPEYICDAIRYHHEIHRLDSNHMSRTMVAILQLAIEVYCRDQRLENPEWSRIHQDVLMELGLDEAGLLEFIDEVLERFHAQ